jgi:flagellar hook assembly protein FlgD
MAGVAAVGGITLAANWSKLPVHKVEGSLVDQNGAPVANAVIDLEKNCTIVKTMTTDASGHFKAYVPQGEYNLIATVGEETAIYTAYTPGKDSLASLMLE